MTRNNNSKVIAVVALIVAVVGLGIGFAAFTSTLTISANATVTPSASTFNVAFDTAYGTKGITCTPTGATMSGTPTVAATAITGIKAAFTEPGQKVVCTAQVKNTGEYAAYLKSVTFSKTAPACTKTADGGATESLVTAACSSISMTVKVGTDTNLAALTATKTGITGHSLAKTTGSEVITLTLEYASGGARADGAFTVDFGNISLLYSTAA